MSLHSVRQAIRENVPTAFLKAREETADPKLDSYGNVFPWQIAQSTGLSAVNQTRSLGASRTTTLLAGLSRYHHSSEQGETAITKYDLASVLLRKGQKDEALSLLEDAANHLTPRIALGLGSDPLFVSLHDDPRFVALIAQVKKKAISTRLTN